MFVKKQKTKNRLYRFKDTMDDWNKGKLEFAEETYYENPNVKKMIEGLARLNRTATLEVLVNQRVGPGEMAKMKLFNHLEIMTGFSIENLNNLKCCIDRAGGVLSLKLMLFFALSQTQNLTNNDIFFYIQGISSFFFQICAESTQVQTDVLKRMAKELGPRSISFAPGEARGSRRGVSEDAICRYMEENIDSVLVYQKEVSNFILSVQKYGKSVMRLREQQHEDLFDYGLMKRIKYYANRIENMPKLEVQSKFSVQEAKKKLYATRVICVGYYERMDALLMAKQVSCEISFYSIREEKQIGKLDLSDVCSSSTATIASFSVYEENDVHFLFVCTTDRSVFLVPLDPERTRKDSEELDPSIIPKSQYFFCSEIITKVVYSSGLDILAGAPEEGNRIIFWHEVKKEYHKPVEIRGFPRSVIFSRKDTAFKAQTMKELRAFSWIIVADNKNHLVVIDPLKNEMILQARSSSAIHTIICDPHGQKIIGIGYEKVYWVYETSKYYREVRSVVFRQAHASIITYGENIPNRRIFITCDETHSIKSWDFDTISCLQIFKLNLNSPISGIFNIGYQGFIALTSVISFITFEDNHNNYTAINDDNDIVFKQGLHKKEVLVVPKLAVRNSNRFLPEFYIGTSEEVRSYQLEDSIMQFRYRGRLLAQGMSRFTMSTFEIIDLPFSAVVLGSENGSLAICPLNNDDPEKVILKEVKEDIEIIGRLNFLLRNPK